jgi:SPFH domain / Band 7 family
VEDPIRSVIAIENVEAAINQIAQTTLRAVVGRHTLDETLSETDTINQNIREILDVQTEEWGIKVTVVELRDIQLPDSMQRAMARQAEAEREKRAKIIAAEGEALAAGELAHASDVMMAHRLALQLRNLQTLVEISVPDLLAGRSITGNGQPTTFFGGSSRSNKKKSPTTIFRPTTSATVTKTAPATTTTKTTTGTATSTATSTTPTTTTTAPATGTAPVVVSSTTTPTTPVP